MNVIKDIKMIILGVVILSGHVSATEQVKSEVFLSLKEAAAGIAYTQDKRLFITYHPFYNPKVKVAERLGNGDIVPFPNADMQNAYDTKERLKSPDEYFNWVLSTRTDGEGTLWILDSGQAEPRITPKLVAWDLAKHQLKKIIHLPKTVALPESQHNDFAISTKHNVIVIADEGIATGPIGAKAALVVINTVTGESRRVMQGTDRVAPRMNMPMLMDKGTPYEKSIDLFIGVDGIALDNQQQWLYFTSVSNSSVYRIKMAELANFSLNNSALVAKVETYADKPMNGGLTIDSAGNLYLCEIGTRTIGIIPADTRKYRVYSHDKNMVWPDGLHMGPEGYLYTSAAQISLSAAFNGGKTINKPPYNIYRFKPMASPLIGR
ncbi:L-dopachrome tautomerase-related protein [Thalassotalea sp. PLHSN55]|uniref:L-dopachrome tautomerase-related protein n=1 Tax=Thalassotalea sp. PLHSN55 TaxID=3435888 RepID=UPI003F83634E